MVAKNGHRLCAQDAHSFVMWLCDSSHHKTETIFPILESGLAHMNHFLVNGTVNKCDASRELTLFIALGIPATMWTGPGRLLKAERPQGDFISPQTSQRPQPRSPWSSLLQPPYWLTPNASMSPAEASQSRPDQKSCPDYTRNCEIKKWLLSEVIKSGGLLHSRNWWIKTVYSNCLLWLRYYTFTKLIPSLLGTQPYTFPPFWQLDMAWTLANGMWAKVTHATAKTGLLQVSIHSPPCLFLFQPSGIEHMWEPLAEGRGATGWKGPVSLTRPGNTATQPATPT